MLFYVFACFCMFLLVLVCFAFGTLEVGIIVAVAILDIGGAPGGVGGPGGGFGGPRGGFFSRSRSNGLPLLLLPPKPPHCGFVFDVRVVFGISNCVLWQLEMSIDPTFERKHANIRTLGPKFWRRHVWVTDRKRFYRVLYRFCYAIPTESSISRFPNHQLRDCFCALLTFSLSE